MMVSAMPEAPEMTSYGAIANATRRKLLDALELRERNVGELVGIAEVSQPAVSQHLKVLASAGLVEERREGRFRVYRLRAEPLADVAAWLRRYERFWDDKLAALGRALDEDEGSRR
jgi:DNA-binding transcriptional ArsR family regulator